MLDLTKNTLSYIKMMMMFIESNISRVYSQQVNIVILQVFNMIYDSYYLHKMLLINLYFIYYLPTKSLVQLTSLKSIAGREHPSRDVGQRLWVGLKSSTTQACNS